MDRFKYENKHAGITTLMLFTYIMACINYCMYIKATKSE